MPRRAHKQGPFWRRLVLVRRFLNGHGALHSLTSTNYTYTGTRGHPRTSLGPTSLAPQQKTEEEQRIPAISRAPRKRQRGGGEERAGVSRTQCACAVPRPRLPRGGLVWPRSQSEGRRERARGLALSGPTSACPTCPPTRVRRSGPQGRGRERRAGVRPCVRLRQRARRRERARGKRWLWPGRLGFLGLCSRARRLARPPSPPSPGS